MYIAADAAAVAAKEWALSTIVKLPYSAMKPLEI